MAGWAYFALGSAFFAGLTAVLAKIGVEGVPSNLATLIRTVVIFGFTAFSSAFVESGRSPASSRSAA